MTLTSLLIIGLLSQAPKSSFNSNPSQEQSQHVQQAPVPKRTGSPDSGFFSQFLKWTHIDGPWTTAQSGMSGYYGVIGAHISPVEKGRLHLYGAPGVMLIKQPVQPYFRTALTWGFNFRLGRVKFLGLKTGPIAYLSIAKCWLSGQPHKDSEAITNSYDSISMIGLSFTLKK